MQTKKIDTWAKCRDKKMKSRVCGLCKNEYLPTGRGQKYCGEYHTRGTCSYKMRAVRRKQKGYDKKIVPYAIHYPKLIELHGLECTFCKTKAHIAIDHIIPKVIGGSNDIENLRFLCRSCNSKRHHTLLKNALRFYFDNGYTE